MIGTMKVLGQVIGLVLLAAAPLYAQTLQDQTLLRFPAVAPLEYTNQATIGDLNGDGLLDIVWANGGGNTTASDPQVLRIYIAVNHLDLGLVTFEDQTIARTGGLAFIARGVDLGDVNGDGALDIIIAQDFNRRPALLINDGAGNFTDQTQTRMPDITLSSSRAQFADVNNDGHLDIYLTNGGATNRMGSGQGKLFINDGNGFFTDQTAARMPGAANITWPSDCIFGDIDGDFDLDLRVASASSIAGQSKMYRNNGAGVFTTMSMPLDNSCWSYDFGDIDGDDDLDLFGANGTNGSNLDLLLRNNFNPANPSVVTFTNVNSSNLGFNPNWDDRESRFFDYDNDGDLDLIIGRFNNVDRVYTNNGAGVYSDTPNVIQGVSAPTLDIAVADLTNDGRLDVITAQGETGDFTNRIFVNVSGPADTIPPRIVNTEQVANTQDAAGPYVVRAMVFDSHSSGRGFHDKGVFLNYSVNDGAVQQAPMKWVGNSMWRGEIPGQVAHSNISYFVTAFDYAGNLGTGRSRHFTILPPPCIGNLNDDLSVNVDDLLVLLANWGSNVQTHTVLVRDFEFDPPTVSARPGDTIQWQWQNGFHTVTHGTCSSQGPLFNFPNVSAAMPVVAYGIPNTFTGPIPYFCVPHCPVMVGQINVDAALGDLVIDGVVNVDDLLVLLANWGPCP